MSCISTPRISIGDIPGLSLLLGDIELAPPALGANLCCKIEIPLPPLPIPIGTALKTLLTNPGTASTLETALQTLSTTMDTLNGLLDQLSFECPLD